MRTRRMRLSEAMRRWRVARAEARRAGDRRRHQWDAEHEERIRAGIKDPHGGGM